MTRGLLYWRTLATWRHAELGFLGLIVHTRTTNPRPWGHWLSRGVRERGGLARRVERGRAHWDRVAIGGQGACLRGPGIAPGGAGYEPAGRLDAPRSGKLGLEVVLGKGRGEDG